MDVLTARRAGNDLHRAGAVVAPGAGPDLREPAATTRKQRRMPGTEPRGAERPIKAARGVEHHLDDALHVAIRGFERADVHAEAARDGGADLFGVQLLALDLAALEHVGGEGLQDGFLAEIESEGFHVTDQPALPVADRRERLAQTLPVPVEAGPVRKFMDIHSPLFLRRL